MSDTPERIPLARPSLDEADAEAIHRVLRSGQLVQGPEVAAFERMVAGLVGTETATAVASCTAALHLALLALEIGPGDVVITTTYSWPATANVIEQIGAQPVFVDICPSTFNMDPDELARVLVSMNRGTDGTWPVKAIIVVHAFGLMADMPSIMTLASSYGIPVIEDAACALGAELDGRPAGAWGLLGCFSFHPRKAITTGEGGVITTNDHRLTQRVRALRNHGIDPEAQSVQFILPGLNYRMTDLQGALGQNQMKKLQRIVDSRRRVAERYARLLANTDIFAPDAASNAHVFQSYVVLLPREFASRRDDVIRQLRNAGVEATIGTYHMPLTHYFQTRYAFSRGDFPNTDSVFDRAISLPIFEGMTSQQQERVVVALLTATEDAAELAVRTPESSQNADSNQLESP